MTAYAAVGILINAVIVAGLGIAWLRALAARNRAEAERDDLWDQIHLYGGNR